mgnify:CR=1 FL=1
MDGHHGGKTIGDEMFDELSAIDDIEEEEQALDPVAVCLLNRVGLDLMYHVDSLPVYVVGGVKNFTTGRSASAANIGIGANLFATDDLAVFVEANRYQGISKSFADSGIKLGATYHFGEAPAAEPG